MNSERGNKVVGTTIFSVLKQLVLINHQELFKNPFSNQCQSYNSNFSLVFSSRLSWKIIGSKNLKTKEGQTREVSPTWRKLRFSDTFTLWKLWTIQAASLKGHWSVAQHVSKCDTFIFSHLSTKAKTGTLTLCPSLLALHWEGRQSSGDQKRQSDRTTKQKTNQK